jgi:uncharacterized protein YjaZ
MLSVARRDIPCRTSRFGVRHRPDAVRCSAECTIDVTVEVCRYQDAPLLCGMCFVVSTLYVPSCYSDATEVVFYLNDGYTFSTSEQRAIQTTIDHAVRDARVLLPDLPQRLIIRVNPGKKVSNDIGASSSHSLPNVIHWMVDPSRPGGTAELTRTHLRATLFHHFHRLTRLAHRPDATVMDQVVGLGLATVFERDAGGRTYPWAQYPANASAWVAELMALPADADRSTWMYRHPDGRRWIGIRAGTYLADRAISASGKSAAQLVSYPSADVIRLAQEQWPR